MKFHQAHLEKSKVSYLNTLLKKSEDLLQYFSFVVFNLTNEALLLLIIIDNVHADFLHLQFPCSLFVFASQVVFLLPEVP